MLKKENLFKITKSVKYLIRIPFWRLPQLSSSSESSCLAAGFQVGSSNLPSRPHEPNKMDWRTQNASLNDRYRSFSEHVQAVSSTRYQLPSTNQRLPLRSVTWSRSAQSFGCAHSVQMIDFFQKSFCSKF